MNPSVVNPWIAKNPGPFRVGDRVSHARYNGREEGVIIEDRGPLGIGGMRIYRLRIRRDTPEDIEFELPADRLELVEAAPVENGKPKK